MFSLCSLVVFCIVCSAAVSTVLSKQGESNKSNQANIRGVNVGGWLLIEEWMFSNGMYDKVAELRDEPQGVILPPMLPNGYGGKFFSEGDMINQLNDKFGADKTVEILEAHRESYVTADDFKEMAERGIDKVRLPVGWWAFCNESATGDASTLISDPYHWDRKFVTIPYSFLTKTLQSINDAGLTALIDIHAMPGGSADGSYNGVFPNEPMFFKQTELMQMGDGILDNMFAFYNDLTPELRDTVSGFTLLNEPAHMVPDDSLTMQGWLAAAAARYRDVIVTPRQEQKLSVPLLFVNLISTSVSDQDMINFMVNTFTADELSAWAVLDIHVYYAWDASKSGCTDMNDDCAYPCSVDVTDPAEFGAMVDGMYAAASSSHAFFSSSGSVPLLACSEFSLATYHDSNNACRGRDWLDVMYSAQAAGFEAQGFGDRVMFWTWKMPFGGSHEAGWALQDYLEGA